MTESEARTKWCPLSRVAAADALGIVKEGKPAHNRAYASLDHVRIDIGSCHCIASDCMFWRTYETPIRYDPQRRDERGMVILSASYGYCGAAGKPF